jgi:hypothetical protein
MDASKRELHRQGRMRLSCAPAASEEAMWFMQLRLGWSEYAAMSFGDSLVTADAGVETEPVPSAVPQSRN